MKKEYLRMLSLTFSLLVLWFGVLKLLRIGPTDTLLSQTFSFLPDPSFVQLLGVLEVFIGGCLLLKKYQRVAILLFWIEMASFFIAALIIAEPLYFLTNHITVPTINGVLLLQYILFLVVSIILYRESA